MMDEKPLLTFPAAHIAEIRLQRPAKANRIERGDLAVLGYYLTELAQKPDLHVLVLSAEGAIFSAGFDLAALTEHDKTVYGGDAQAVPPFERLANQLELMPCITIAAINGPVIGGASDLALACDLRIGVESTSMFMPAAQFGLPLYPSAIRRYVAAFGLTEAQRLILTAGKISAQEMRANGFLSELIPEAALKERIESLSHTMAAMPAGPLLAMKRALQAAGRGQSELPEIRAAINAAFHPEEVVKRIHLARESRNIEKRADSS